MFFWKCEEMFSIKMLYENNSCLLFYFLHQPFHPFTKSHKLYMWPNVFLTVHLPAVFIYLTTFHILKWKEAGGCRGGKKTHLNNTHLPACTLKFTIITPYCLWRDPCLMLFQCKWCYSQVYPNRIWDFSSLTQRSGFLPKFQSFSFKASSFCSFGRLLLAELQ